MVNLLGMDKKSIVDLCSAVSAPGYRAEQVFQWVCKGVPVDGMTNVPKVSALRLRNPDMTLSCPK